MDWMSYERIGHRRTLKSGWGLYAPRTERRFFSGGDPSPPPAPDPAAIIAAQNQALTGQTNANRVNTYGPTGATEWSLDPTTGRWTQTIAPSAATQGLLTSAQGNAQNALNSIGGVAPLATSFGNPGVPVGALNNPGVPVGSLAPGGNIQTGLNLQTGLAPAGNIRTSLDLSGISGIPQADSSVRDQVVQSLYGQNTSRLDPQWAQQQTQLETKLANQGVPQNSDAWNKAMDDFQRSKTDAYSTALNAAIGSGGDAMSQLFNMGLQANQTGYGEALGAANFANAAQSQQYAQGLSSGQFANAAQEAAGNFANAAQAQQFGQNLNAGQFANTAAGQNLAQQLMAGNFANSAAGQGYGQNQGEAAFGNQAQQQTLQDLLAQIGLPNQIALPTGQGNPSTTQGVADVLGANSLATQAGLATYQQQMQNQAAKNGGVSSLLGTVGSVALLAAL